VPLVIIERSDMSLKTRWLTSMLGVVLVGTAITTLISSSISYYGAGRAADEWLSASHRRATHLFHQQFFERLEAQAQFLAQQPALASAVSARSPSEIAARMGSLWTPQDGGFWAVVGRDGTVLAASDASCRLEGARERRAFIMCGRLPAFAVTTAVSAAGQDVQGSLVLGLQMNGAYADAYFAAVGTELVLLDRQGQLTTSLLNTSGERIAADLGAVPAGDLWAERPHFGRYEIGVTRYRGYHGGTQPRDVGVSSLRLYLLSLPLLPGEPQVPVRAVLLAPSEIMDNGAFYSTLILIICGLLLLPLLGLVVWRLVTGFVKPISQLGEMTARVAEGNLDGGLPVTRQDELGQLTRDFNDMVTRLRETQRRLMHSEKMAAVGQLAAGVGHEINNPLAYVSSNLGFATETLSELSATQAGPALAPEHAQRLQEVTEALQEARDGARRVARIVQDLRTFARDTGAEEKQVLEVHQVLESALKFTANTLRYRARVTRDFRETARVEANEARLVQVFINLLVNAAQAIPEGRAEEHEIRVTLAPAAGGACGVEVSDTGAGMTPEVLERIFEPFFTTKSVGQGTGLGLSICRNIIEALGGSLAVVQSAPGRGSTFRVTLPPARREAVEDRPAPATPPTHEQGGRVLVVDDEPFIGASARRILRSVCEVVVVTSSREALALVEQGQRFELVLCDLMMPRMTGMELHEELSRRAPDLAARMLFLTGGAFTPEAQRFLSQQRWLEKPFDNEALRACVSEWLRTQGRPGQHVA
jgi:signal transduction histidine kinase